MKIIMGASLSLLATRPFPLYNKNMFIHVKAFPNAKEEKVEKLGESQFKIWVKEEAERNMANERILEITRKMFNTRDVQIISGHTSPSKLLSIDAHK